MYSNTNRRGMTLLEITVASAILAVVMGAVFTALHFMSRDMSREVSNTVLNQESARSLEKMMAKLRGASLENLADAGGASVEYYVPVDVDKDGDVVDGGMYIDWGQDGPKGEILNAVTVLRFTSVSMFDEKTRKFDLNRDGDMKDSFQIGRLEEAFYSTATVTGKTPHTVRSLTPDIVIQPAPKASADLNGDGEDDPIFLEDGNILRIRLYVTRSDEAEPRFELFEASVMLRNW